MFSQSPHDNVSIQDRYTGGRLIHNKLEQIGLGSVADFFNQPGPAMTDKPSVSMPRRRARPLTEMEADVAEDDAHAANALLSVTRQLEGDADRLLLREGLEHVSPDQPGHESKHLRCSLQHQGELKFVAIHVNSPECHHQLLK